MEDWKTELLSNLLGCGWRDLDKFEEFLNKAEAWDIKIDLYDIVEETKDIHEAVGFNTLLHTLLDEIFNDLISEFDDEDAELLRDNFAPHLNFLDSWFNNPLDDLDENSTREDAIRKLSEWLEELKEFSNKVEGVSEK